MPSPEGMSTHLAEARMRERGFLEQLLDGSKIEKFEPLVPIKVLEQVPWRSGNRYMYQF